ncbi:MAG TPA: DUF3107 domain-containing protein [Streptosporangiaceae bacterium]|nr:DUF3107 domain-containing protein [Streptosporangiaceae bacterium]
MEVKIGIQLAQRELVIETALSAEEVEHAVEEALADGRPLKLADSKGNTILVAPDKIAYLELNETSQRQVGFGAR